MKMQFIFYSIAVAILVAVFQNCTGSNSAQLNEVASSLVETVKAAPIIDCKLKRAADGMVVSRIHSLSAMTSVMTTSVIENQNVELDCRRSAYSDGSPGNFIFRFQQNLDNATVIENASGVFSFSYDSAGDYTLQISLVDEEGVTRSKTATILVQCDSSSSPILVNDINVEATDKRGYLRYSAVGVSGGLPPYQYAWDFNGDLRPDQQSGAMVPWVFWRNVSSSTPVYSIFGGNRTVKVYVKDSCNQVVTKTFSKTIPLPRLAAGAVAVQDPEFVYYLQTDINPVSVASNNSNILPWSRVDLTAHLPPSPPDQVKHVYCAYSREVVGGVLTGKGGLKVESFHLYGSNSATSLKHGFRFQINNISDDGSTSEAIAVGNPELRGAKYTVAESPDAVMGYDLEQIDACQVSLRIIPVSSASSCDGSPLPQARVLRFLGEFSCPLLRSGQFEVSATAGKFYCEAGEFEHCAGGPGGGGPGNPPPGR